MSKTKILRTKSFFTASASGVQIKIHRYVEVHYVRTGTSSGPKPVKGNVFFETSDGTPVNQIGDGKYQILRTEGPVFFESLRSVTS